MESQLLEDALCIARNYGRRVGLNIEDNEDCAAHFAARMLTTSPPAGDVTAWLRRCAHNHVIDTVRALRRRQTHICPWLQVRNSDGSVEDAEYAADAPGIDDVLMQDEFWRYLMAALAKLDPIPQQIFLRHHLNGEPVQALAVAFDRTTHAIEQTLFRARKHLRRVLEQQGLTEAELL